MTIHVVGVGAIGGIVGATLSVAGRQVQVVDVNLEHVAAIRRSGLRVTGKLDLRVRVDAVTPDDLTGPMDTVILAVKTRHTASALRAVEPFLGLNSCVISMQNGLAAYEVAARLGLGRVLGALVTFGGHYVEPGVVAYAGSGSFVIGELQGRRSPRTAVLAQVLADVHPVSTSDNVLGHLWTKTSMLAFYFATAIADRDVTQLLKNAESVKLFSALVAEVAGVAARVGVRCEPVDGFDAAAFHAGDSTGIDRSWASQLDYWAQHTQPRTGMWRDLVVHRRPTEIDHIVGPVLELAEKSGVEVPLLRQLGVLLHLVQEGNRDVGPQLLVELWREGHEGNSGPHGPQR